MQITGLTPIPFGKQRQKKSGRGRPTPSFIASVRTPVISTENSRPDSVLQRRHDCTSIIIIHASDKENNVIVEKRESYPM